MNFKFLAFLIFSLTILLISCKDKDEENEPMLIFKYTFDEQGERLDNFGNPTTIPAGNAAQTPDFIELGVSSIELINYVVSLPTSSTIVYMGPQVEKNGVMAIDFDNEKIVKDGEVLVKIPLSQITPGSYTYLRNSLSYQHYNIDFLYNDVNLGALNLQGEIASFVGFKTFINDYQLGAEIIPVNSVVNQGYFGFHIDQPIPYTQTGNAPVTTVPNPLDAVSPIPLGSCLVTGGFVTPLVITGNETEDIIVEVAISINQSFEWEESTIDGKYEPLIESVVDMGTRGLKATVK
jgi:hypothetical protein